MNEKVQFAKKTLSTMAKEMYYAEKKAINVIKDVLRPCNGGECLIGTEDFADDIFYVYGEPKPNVFRRVLSVRLNKITDELEVQLEGEPIGDMIEGGWTPFDRAFIVDIHFLLDEIGSNIEYSDGYQDGEQLEKSCIRTKKNLEMSKFFPTFVQEKKPQRIMTKAELDFYERMPRLMHQLVEEVKSLTEQVSALTEEVKSLKNGTDNNK